MIADPLLIGSLVYLAPLDEGKDLPILDRWNLDAEYYRLANGNAFRAVSLAAEKGWLKKDLAEETMFGVRTLAEDRLIGTVELSHPEDVAGNAWLGIGIGEHDFWGRGFGTDAMRLAVRYGFEMLNVHRISLNVFSYNERAIQCYLKAGFQLEGRLREWGRRDGQWFDLVFMAILRKDYPG